MSRRYYSSVAIANSTSAALDETTTTIALTSALVGWPTTYPFTAALDEGTSTEEVVSVVAAAGASSVAVTRAIDGSRAYAHLTSATFTHVTSAEDFDEPNAHIQSSHGIHGLGSSDTVASGTALTALTATVTTNASTAAAAATANTNAITSVAATAAGADTNANLGISEAQAAQTTANNAAGAAAAAQTTANAAQTTANQANGSRVELYAVGGGIGVGGAPPPPTSVLYLMQAGSFTVTLGGGGGSTANFPASFPSGVLTIMATLGESASGANGSVYVSAAGSSKNGFSFVVPGAAGDLVRINYIAIGW